MNEESYEVTILLHTGGIKKITYYDTHEQVEDAVSKIWYEGFLDVNPDNPKRKIHILPDAIRRIEIAPLEN